MKNELLAPNGKPSNLNATQYKLVRTSAFKKWFGDWENDPENSSKVVDENGEPLVVYHGTYLDSERWNVLKTGLYFTDNIVTAKEYNIGDYVFYKSFSELEKDLGSGTLNYIKKNWDIDESNGIMYSADSENVWEGFDFNKIYVYQCFLNIRKPKIYYNADKDDMTNYNYQPTVEKLIKDGYDGVIGIYPYRWFSEDKINYKNGIIGDYEKEKHYVFVNPNQAKLADGTNSLFDANSDDIRFAKGGKTKGDCYLVAGQIAMEIRSKKIDYKGTPYLVHAEVKHSQIDGLRYGHAFIEDDENVYDFSNNREIIMPKQLYYYFGDINPTDKKKYRKYTFKQAREKMVSTGNYGCWDIEVEFNSGGEIVKSHKREIPDYLKMFLDL